MKKIVLLSSALVILSLGLAARQPSIEQQRLDLEKQQQNIANQQAAYQAQQAPLAQAATTVPPTPMIVQQQPPVDSNSGLNSGLMGIAGFAAGNLLARSGSGSSNRAPVTTTTNKTYIIKSAPAPSYRPQSVRSSRPEVSYRRTK